MALRIAKMLFIGNSNLIRSKWNGLWLEINMFDNIYAIYNDCFTKLVNDTILFLSGDHCLNVNKPF